MRFSRSALLIPHRFSSALRLLSFRFPRPSLRAKVIYRLWKDDNRDLLIMPGSLPLHDGSSRNELTYYLPAAGTR